jgi:hypothetical protein
MIRDPAIDTCETGARGVPSEALRMKIMIAFGSRLAIAPGNGRTIG